ncbi:G-D-S-L family lipolytic protein [Zhouia sp. PK063]|uniref:G-D-S-L family lipolytic protein n=1 Tax=Zhouia sp. PK063 TaxID=3373602 RepID=UPI00379AF198
MMKNIKYYIILLGLTLVGCQPEFNDPVEDGGNYASGTADFSNYVAVGNSLTAGYADGALYMQGQQNSYPSIIASKLEFAGGGEFKQPLVNDNLGGLLFNGTQITDNRLVLSISNGDTLPTNLEGTPSTDIANKLSGSFNNMGVPGAKIFHLLAPGYGNAAGVLSGAANPYFVRFASSENTTVISDAIAQNPTFFTLWIGNNDILSYATSGGVGVDQNGNVDPSTYGSNDITDPNVFASVYNQLLTALTANGAKGVVANIPDVSTIPYFTTVPYNPVPLDQATADQLNQGYAQYNGGLQVARNLGLITAEEAQKRTVSFSAGTSNAVVIEDEYLTNLSALGLPNYRQATAADLIVLPASSFIGTTVGGDATKINGVSVPLEDKWVLVPQEQQAVVTAQTSFNATIKALANQYGLGMVDTQALLQQVANGGVSYGGGTLTSTYGSGGAFSLDGVHPTAKGYAVIANLFIDKIQETYGATLPHADVAGYTDVFIK